MHIQRREFIKAISAGGFLASLGCISDNSTPVSDKPNIVLCMADDLGWGDTAYNGHPNMKTPHLDNMAASGIRFDRFYSSSPVCSPTRGSCLTGRHPYRYGIFGANVGHLPTEEMNLAEVLKEYGYTTGHFGKWHLGTLTKTVKDSNRGGPDSVAHYQPPWINGFDVCFSTEAKVPVWDPMMTPEKAAGGVRTQKKGEAYGTYYWTGPGKMATENLSGDDSRIIMDRVIPFIREAVGRGMPFFTVIWFHAPHLPVLAGPDYYTMYLGLTEEERHYNGCITALDDQIGRLRSTLREIGVAENTMFWFSSDNGPEWKNAGERACGSAGPFRGMKRSLFEGGIRVPGILEWPSMVKKPRSTDIPCCSSDYFPTVLDMLDIGVERVQLLIDGVSLVPLIKGNMDKRPLPIAFQSGKQYALNGNMYKLITQDKGETYMLFDIVNDPGETSDIAKNHPLVVNEMKARLEIWLSSCEASLNGADYH